VTEVNPDALAIAATLDAERANGTIRSALHGLPLLIKNNIGTKDLMNNTAGSYSLLGATLPRDSTMAARLRSAGVILLGKSNLSQWANFRSSNSVSPPDDMLTGLTPLCLLTAKLILLFLLVHLLV
jgi:amidase